MLCAHDPKTPVEEVLHCGCFALPFRREWHVAAPLAKAFRDAEIARNPRKVHLDQMGQRVGLRQAGWAVDPPSSRASPVCLSVGHVLALADATMGRIEELLPHRWKQGVGQIRLIRPMLYSASLRFNGAEINDSLWSTVRSDYLLWGEQSPVLSFD